MNEIQILNQETIDQIAAGEVIERPYSVVKELVENAMDAGANAISVEIKGGGKELIRVTDNGSGIAKNMLSVAFLRHATSKLRHAEELSHIKTLGFRGEALSSIAAVSRTECMTKTEGELMGTRYLIEGGREAGMETVGVPNGTTFLVKDLFYNTPVRLQFLKSDVTEGNYINSLMEQLALSHPEVSFSLIVNGRQKLHTSGNGSLKDVIYQIYGRDIYRELVEVEHTGNGIGIRGYVAKPAISRGNRNYECFFVNGRMVEDKILSKAVEAVYHDHTYLMQHQFPMVFLCVDTDLDGYVDVNVHPTKREVRFANGSMIHDLVYRAVEEALTPKDLVPEVSEPKIRTSFETPVRTSSGADKSSQTMQRFPQPFERESLLKIQKEIAADTPYEPKFSDKKPVNPDQRPPALPKTEQMKITDYMDVPATEVKYFQYIGQVMATYLICEYDHHLYIVDQHAAHEKVNYEKFMQRFENKDFESQMITPTIVLTLTAREEEIYLQHQDIFRAFAFEIEAMGGRDYGIYAVPTDLYGFLPEEFFRALVDEFDEGKSRDTAPDIIAQRIATAACKASVKGHDVLSAREAEDLLRQLFALKDPYHCPHGRPTMISMSQTELEKKFHRIV